MKSILETMKNIELVEDIVTIRSTMKESDIQNIGKLVNNML